jgi:hypothetical protein
VKKKVKILSINTLTDGIFVVSLHFEIKNKYMKYSSTKIEKESEKITPFAGISLINNEFNRCGMSELIDKELGARVTLYGYQYSDIIRALCNVYYSGGNCVEDIQTHFGFYLKAIPNNPTPSSDTILRGMKELTKENVKVKSTSDKEYNFNINKPLNLLNIRLLKSTGQLESGGLYDFDYDNQILEHDKYDAKTTYKKNKGYCPGVGTIGSMIVYLENRDGNANVKTGQSETLTRAFEMLKSEEIYINRSRMDAGSYSEDIVKAVALYSKLFYIRANRSEGLYGRISEITEWKTVEINYKQYEVSSLPFTQFLQDRKYRLVIMREKREDNQLDLFEGRFKYRSILTNDYESSEQEVIEYYNQRGASEKIFDIQNNDFGWGHLPFSDLDNNTVFLLIMALLKNFYNYIVKKVSEVFDGITPVTRLKRFIFLFITVPGKWIYRGRQWILKLFTDKPYEKVFVPV